MPNQSQHSVRLLEAFAFAAEKHGAQKRKLANVEKEGGRDEIPYLSHLMAVAAIVFEAGGDEDAVIAGLLHDVVEDQQVSLATIRDMFGAAVAEIVDSCSEHWDQIPGQGKPPWEDRKQAHFERLQGADAAALLVTAADKIHNGESILNDINVHGAVVWQRFNTKPGRIKWYYESVSSVVAAGLGADSYAAIRLDKVVTALNARVAEWAALNPEGATAAN